MSGDCLWHVRYLISSDITKQIKKTFLKKKKNILEDERADKTRTARSYSGRRNIFITANEAPNITLATLISDHYLVCSSMTGMIPCCRLN